MSNPHQGTTPRVPNAFSDTFLQLDAELNEPAEGNDPTSEGPWIVHSVPADHPVRREWPEWQEVHGLWRMGERPERGGRAAFLASSASLALYASIGRPVAGRDLLYELGKDEWRGGYPLSRQGRIEAWMEVFHPEWALITSAYASLGQRPHDLAVILEAVGPSCRRHAGVILGERLFGSRL